MEIKTKFDLGKRIMTTAGINEALRNDPKYNEEVWKCFNRHIQGDWGDLCDEDKALNDEAINNGSRILSAYETSHGRVYVITEGDRRNTTILFANEY